MAKIEKQENNKHHVGNPMWTKGQSGNPNGRPKKIISLTSEMKAQLSECCPLDNKGRTWLKYLVEKWLTQAADNATYFKELLDRLEGKVAQPLTGQGGGAVEVAIDAKGKLAQLLETIASRKSEGG